MQGLLRQDHEEAMRQCSQLLARTLSLCGALLQAGCDVVCSAPLLLQVWTLRATPPAYSVDTCVAKLV